MGAGAHRAPSTGPAALGSSLELGSRRLAPGMASWPARPVRQLRPVADLGSGCARQLDQGTAILAAATATPVARPAGAHLPVPAPRAGTRDARPAHRQGSLPGSGVAGLVDRRAGADSELVARLRSRAVEYVRAGWPVVAVAAAGDRLVAELTPADPAAAAVWWSDQPYGIGCRLGERFDALAIPRDLGARIVDQLPHSHALGVIEIPGQAHWLFLVTPGARRIRELAQCRQVRLYTTGWWIPLPPTPVSGEAVRWISEPDPQRPTHSLVLQWMVHKTLLGHLAEATPATRQSSGRTGCAAPGGSVTVVPAVEADR